MSIFANKGFFIWFLASIFYAYQYVIRVLPNVISPMIVSKFDISTSALGQFSGLYYIGYTLSHIPIGILLDKYGPKYVVFFSMLLTAFGMLPLICSDIWLYSQIGRVVVGMGSAAAALGVFKISVIYYPDKFPLMVGISIIIGLLGAMYGGLPLLYFIQKFGWDFVFFIYIMFGALQAIVFFICTTSQYSCDSQIESVWSSVKAVFSNKRVILISLFAGFMVGPLEGFADGWATTFLSEGYGISYDTSSLLSSLIFLGMCFGSFFLPYISGNDIIRNFNIILLCALLMFCAFVVLLACYVKVSVVMILLFIVGFGCAYQVILSSNIVLYVKDYHVALASALSNMIVMMFGYFFHTFISMIIEWGDLFQITDSGIIYGKNLLVLSLSVVPIGLVIGFLGCMWLKSDQKKYKEN